MVDQTLEALIAAQEIDMLHRDIKPSNVMVSWLPSGRFQVKLLDFGLAKLSQTPALQTINHGDAIMGSIYFMAPEQFDRELLDARTDLYSLGCLYYYGLTGSYPFDGDSAPEVMIAHIEHSVKPLENATCRISQPSICNLGDAPDLERERWIARPARRRAPHCEEFEAAPEPCPIARRRSQITGPAEATPCSAAS